ncbi:MAG: cupin domain-containing protein [Tannerella sp.]|nr:cupin domain-containing protein [Tannerella sp.]
MMKTHLLLLGLCLSGFVVASDYPGNSQDEDEKDKKVVLKDYGKEPTVLDIDAYTLANTTFRTVLWTGDNLQVTLMSIPVGGEVGLEIHAGIDQFLRIEEGEGQVMMGDSKESLTFIQSVSGDFAIMVPAGKWHNIVNTGNKPLKLYSIYAPPEHPHGTVHKTYEDAMEAEHNH